MISILQASHLNIFLNMEFASENFRPGLKCVFSASSLIVLYFIEFVTVEK